MFSFTRFLLNADARSFNAKRFLLELLALAVILVSPANNSQAFTRVAGPVPETGLASERTITVAAAPSSFLPNPLKTELSGNALRRFEPENSLPTIDNCRNELLKNVSFQGKWSAADRVKLCRLIDDLRAELWSLRGRVPELDHQVRAIWSMLPLVRFEQGSYGNLFFKGVEAESVYYQYWSPETGGVEKQGIISLRLSEKKFPYLFLHELRHIYDRHEISAGRMKASNARKLEEIAFLLESYYTEASNKRVFLLKEFWRDDWSSLPREERRNRAMQSISRYINAHYDF